MKLLDRLKAVFASSQTTTTTSSAANILLFDNYFSDDKNDATKSAAVYRCMTLIAGWISVMPLRVKERYEPRSEKIKSLSLFEKRFADHLDQLLLFSPNGRDDAKTFYRNMMMDLLSDGNFFALIEKNSVGFIEGLYPIAGNDILQIVAEDPNRFPFKRVIYTTNLPGWQVVPDFDMIHVAAPRFTDRPTIYSASDMKPYLLGVPPLAAARAAMRLGIDLDNFISAYFTNAITGDLLLMSKDPTGFTIKQVEDMATTFKRRAAGRNNFRTPVVLPGAVDVKSLKAHPSSGQLDALRKLMIEEIGRTFGVPKEFLNTASTSGLEKGIEGVARNFHRYTIKAWVSLIEGVMEKSLLPRRLRNFYEIRFDDNELLRADSKVMSEIIAKLVGGPGAQGIATINEGRKIMGLTKLKDARYDEIIQSGSAATETEEKDVD